MFLRDCAGLGRDALGDGPGSGVDGELAGDVDRLACCDALRIRPDGGGRLCSGECLFHNSLAFFELQGHRLP